MVHNIVLCFVLFCYHSAVSGIFCIIINRIISY